MDGVFEQGLRQLIIEIVRDELGKFQHTNAVDEYLTTAEAAAYAKVAPGTIRRWIRGGRLVEHRAGRTVRVMRANLDKLLSKVRARDLTPEQLAMRAFQRRFG